MTCVSFDTANTSCWDLDNLLQDTLLRPPLFIKVDVPGHTVMIIKGLQQYVAAYQPVVHVSLQRDVQQSNDSWKAIAEFVKKFPRSILLARHGQWQEVTNQQVDWSAQLIKHDLLLLWRQDCWALTLAG